jgi:DnaK suppressor protein
MRNDIEQKEFKQLILRRLEELEAGRSADADRPVELDQSRVGRLSRMDSMQSQAMARHGSRRAEQEIERLRAALKRIESGDYGYCARCEEEIADGRLRFDPGATLCIDCAE